MCACRILNVLGEHLEIYASGAMTNGSVAVVVQTSPPGGGPPLHVHTREDETFCVLQGSFEFFVGDGWHPVPVGIPLFGPRGIPHSFRNTGATSGRVMITISPPGMERFFEEVDGISLEAEEDRVLELFDRYGIALYQDGGFPTK